MLFSAGKSRDLVRAIVGTLLVAGIIYGLEWLMPSTSAEDIVIEPMYVYGVVAGIVAYALGRSRRNAFICSVFGKSSFNFFSIKKGITKSIKANIHKKALFKSPLMNSKTIHSITNKRNTI